MDTNVLIPTLRDISNKCGNIEICIYDKRTEKTYRIEDIVTTETEVRIVVDTSTEVEKRIHKIIDKSQISETVYDGDLVTIKLKNGSTRKFKIQM